MYPIVCTLRDQLVFSLYHFRQIVKNLLINKMLNFYHFHLTATLEKYDKSHNKSFISNKTLNIYKSPEIKHFIMFLAIKSNVFHSDR